MSRDDALTQALSLPALDWRAEQLQSALQGLCPGLVAQARGLTGSTNADLLDLGRLGDVRPRVLVAEAQSAGRGRMGRQWHSVPGASLTFSIGLPLRPRQGWGSLSLVVGHAVAETLQPWSRGVPPSGQGRLLIKWPNDLWWYSAEPRSEDEWAAGRKVAGILIETLPMPAELGDEGRRWVVIGVGLNVDAQALQVGSPRDPPVAATSEWWGPRPLPDWWHALVPPVLGAVLDFERSGAGPRLDGIRQRDLLAGRSVLLSGGPLRQAQCLGIDADGALRVRAEGQEQRVMAGEVSIRPRGAGLT